MEVCVKVGKELASDLYQEVFKIICEKDQAWVVEKYNSGYWQGIIIRTIFNQHYGQRTEFYKNYHRPIGTEDVDNIELYAEDYDFELDQYITNKHLVLESLKDHLDWYHRKIWNLYIYGNQDKGIKPRSARSISKQTGISRHEILRIVNYCKNYIKNDTI
jgi:hypothetical protein